jgi:hypothetical protein
MKSCPSENSRSHRQARIGQLGLIIVSMVLAVAPVDASVNDFVSKNQAVQTDITFSQVKRLIDDVSLSVNDVSDEEAPTGWCAKTVRGELRTADGRLVPDAKLMLLRGRRYPQRIYHGTAKSAATAAPIGPSVSRSNHHRKALGTC